MREFPNIYIYITLEFVEMELVGQHNNFSSWGLETSPLISYQTVMHDLDKI